MRFNPPPGWPQVPAGFAPPPDWRPNPSWPVPPPGWTFWVADDPTSGATNIADPGQPGVVVAVGASAPPTAIGVPSRSATVPETFPQQPDQRQALGYSPAAYGPVVAGAPAFAPQAAPPLYVTCRFCGCRPVLDAKARGHRGMIILMQFRSVGGPFCRSCGLAVTRKLSADTLVQGWWGAASFFITPVILLLNVLLLNRLASLPQPNPGSTRTADPGPRLVARWQMIGLMIPLLVLLLVFVRP